MPSDKTEEATPKRRREARRKGQVARSADLAPWAALLVGLYLVPGGFGRLIDSVAVTLVRMREFSAQPDADQAPRFLAAALLDGFLAVTPLVLAVLATGVVLSVAQTGLLFTSKPLVPDMKRINPILGFRRLLSPRSLWDAVKQILKVVVIAVLAWPRFREVIVALTGHGRLALHDGVVVTLAAVLGLARTITATVLVLALVDYGYQRFQHRRDLRMTKQEIRDEHRMAEGDAMVKGRIRAIQRALARDRMLGEIGRADVVITNPTHIAVALYYDPAKGGAPVVLAVGAGALAARIREHAAKASVPMVEAKPLARALWRVCAVGDPIPVALYEAVAKVLAFVRRLDRRIMSARPMELPRTSQVDAKLLEALPKTPRRRRR